MPTKSLPVAVVACFFALFAALAARAAPVINEVQSTNTNLADQYGQLIDWVEIYNPDGSSFDLSGYYLSDSLSNKLKYQFPSGTTIAAGGYLLIWCGNTTDYPANGTYPSGQLRATGFNISSGGEPILLTSTDGTTIIDQTPALPIGTAGTPAVGRSLGRGTGDSFGTLYFYTSPTQGTVNNTSGTEAIPLTAPSFSVSGGIYTNNQTITITTTETNAVIRYTLDGSDPTETSPIYSNAVTMTSAGNTNTTNSWIPSNDVISSDYPYYDAWQAPSGSVARINVLRARVFSTGKAPSRITTKSYLINPQGTNRYAFPIVSIATTPANLFSDATGIYVKGTNTYATNVIPQAVWANYFQSGSAWERPGSVEFFEKDGSRLLEGEIGLRLNGNTTRQRPRKALRVYNRNSSGGSTWTNTQLFPDKSVLSWDTFILRAAGNDWNQALFRDALVSEISSNAGLDRQASRPVVVFLDGEYWGLHNLRDRIDEPWFYNTYGLGEPDYTLLEVVNGGPDDFFSPGDYSRPIYDSGNTNGLADFIDIFNTAATNGYASAAGYTNLAARIDLDNFIDYHAITIWGGNTDWPGNNMLIWRSTATNNANSRLDARWRYIIKDNDFALGVNLPYVPGWDADAAVMARYDTLAFATSPSETAWANNTNGTLMLRKTLDNAIFRTNFINRFADLLNSTLSTNRTLAKLQDYADLYGPGTAEHFNRWPVPLSWTNDGVGRIRAYLTARTDAVRRHIGNKFGLPTARLTVNVNDAAHGTVTVNRLNINPATDGLANTNAPYPWTGTYFQSNALTVTAVPNPGYRFVSWTDASDVTVGSDSTANYEGSGKPGWTNGSSAGSGFGAWSFSEAGTANDGFFVGSSGRSIHSASADGRSFGIYGHSGGWARAARLFTNTLQTNQTFRVKISPGGFTASSSKGVDFGQAGTNRFSFYASDYGGAPAYYFRNDATISRVDDSALFTANTDNTFDLSLTRLSNNVFRLSVVRGGQIFETNFTATGPVDRADFFNYYSENGNDTNNLYFNNLVMTDPGTTSNGGVATNTNVAPSITLAAGARTLTANFEQLPASGLIVQIPAVGAAGIPISGIQVTATNSNGDADSAFTNSVVLTMTGNNGVTLYYTNNAVSGVATFSNVIVPSGATYTLSALGGGLGTGAGTNFVISDGALYLPALNGVWNTATNWDVGIVPNSTTARAIIPANASTNRTVTNDSSVTVAALTFSNGSSAFANTISGAAGNSLTFQATDTNALIKVTGSGTGNAEINLTGPVVLNSDLVVDVQSTNSANQEYGAMRLRGTNWSGTGGVTKRGPGMAGFTQAGKAISGNIVVQQGVLTFSEPSISSLNSTNITVQSGGQLRLSSASATNNVPRTNSIKGPLNLAGSGRTGVGTNENLGVLGALRLELVPPSTGTTAVLTNKVNLTATADIHVPAGNTIQLNGPLTAASNSVIMSKSGGGTLTLGTNAAGFTGGITVNRGTLRLAGTAFTNTTNALVLTNETTLMASGQWSGAVQAGTNSALAFELGATPSGTAVLSAGMATFSGSNSVVLTVPTNAAPGTYALLTTTGSITTLNNLSLASSPTNFAWSQLIQSNNTIYALFATNIPTLPTAWHKAAVTEDLLVPASTMRTPTYEFGAGTNITIYTGLKKFNNAGYGTANQTGGTLYYRAGTNGSWSSAALEFHQNNGDYQFWKATLPSNAVTGVAQYYIRMNFDGTVASPVYLHGADGGSSITTSEATAQAAPFSLRNRPSWIFHGDNRLISGSSVTFSALVGYVANDGSYQAVDRGYIYYTTDGTTPVGSLGVAGNASTQVVAMEYVGLQQDASEAGEAMRWQAVVAGLPSFTNIKYRIGFWNTANNEEQFAGYNTGATTDYAFTIGTYGAPQLTVSTTSNGALNGDYTTTKLYVDEVAGDSIPITVTFAPNTSNVTAVELFSNLNNRDRANSDNNADGIPDGIKPPDGNTISVTNTNSYYRAYTMTNAGAGNFTATLNATKTGAYRLSARYKTGSDTNWVWYSSGGRRDHAITVAPVQARDIRMYELNIFNIEASGKEFANRSTIEDLTDRAGAKHTASGRVNNFNLGYLQKLGVNWIWFQPYHPYGWEGKHLSAANIRARDATQSSANTKVWDGSSYYEDVNYPYALGSPYAVKNFWEVEPRMSAAFSGDPANEANVGSSTNRAAAMTAFRNFMADADAAGINLMPDAAFNHGAWDIELGQAGVDYIMPAANGSGWTAADLIHNREVRFFSKRGDYAQRASYYTNFENNDIAPGPDRGDFGKWLDVIDIFFGRYAALVNQNPADNENRTSEADWFNYDAATGNFDGITQGVWKYFAQYGPYWLGKGRANGTNRNSTDADGDAAARYAWDARGIDGLRCDFGQGLPPQCWEYIINTARSYKWSFVFMSESLDGGAITYRSNRHFDILNENIVFPGKYATTTDAYRYMFYLRRASYGQGLVLLNTVSHDEDNYNDPWEAFIRYAVYGTIDGAPLIFPGQELGISNLWGYDLYEINFNKPVPHFKTYNSMMTVWGNTDYSLDQLSHAYSAINAARSFSPALRSANRHYLDRKAGGVDQSIFSIGKFETLNGSPASKDVVFGFVNLNRNGGQSNTFNVNIDSDSNGVNDFGIKSGRTYNVKNIAAHLGQSATRRDTFLWGAGLTGANILSDGVFVGLNAIPGSSEGAWTAAPYEALYLKLYDTTAPIPVSGSVTNNLANGSYGITNQATFTWAAVPADSEGIVPKYKVNVSVNGAPATSTVIIPNSFTYTAPNADTKVEITVQAVNPNDTNSASAATVTNTAYLLTANGDYDNNGVSNQNAINSGLSPIGGKVLGSVVLGNLVQSYTGSARTATATTTPTNLAVNFTYNGSATAPTSPGLYTVVGTISDSIFEGASTNNFVITGVLPGNDTLIKTNNTTQHRYSFAQLLANDARVATNGVTLTNSSLSIVGVAAGTGNSVSIKSSFVIFTPSATSPETFTYAVTDGTTTNTATVTVTLGSSTNVPAPFELKVIRAGMAVYDGSSTRMTNDFIGVPNQTYAIEYKGDMAEPSWSSAGATNTGPTGSFSVLFNKEGNHADDWNGGMFFRGVRTNQ